MPDTMVRDNENSTASTEAATYHQKSSEPGQQKDESNPELENQSEHVVEFGSGSRVELKVKVEVGGGPGGSADCRNGNDTESDVASNANTDAADVGVAGSRARVQEGMESAYVAALLCPFPDEEEREEAPEVDDDDAGTSANQDMKVEAVVSGKKALGSFAHSAHVAAPAAENDKQGGDGFTRITSAANHHGAKAAVAQSWAARRRKDGRHVLRLERPFAASLDPLDGVCETGAVNAAIEQRRREVFARVGRCDGGRRCLVQWLLRREERISTLRQSVLKGEVEVSFDGVL